MRDQVLAYFRRWIGILRLGDENRIQLRLVPGKTDLGECVIDPRYGRARIEVRDPSDGTHPDWEESVIHELLHVRIPIAVPEGSPLREIVEHSVEIMSRILHSMDTGGASTEALYRKAHTWARTTETALRGQRMKRMGNPAALAALAMDAGAAIAADPPDVAAMTELLKKLIALAAGGDADPVDPEMGKDPAVGTDPMLAADPKDPAAAMYRAALGPERWATFVKNAQLGAKTIEQNTRANIITMARTHFGEGANRLTVEEEAKLLKMTPHDAALWIDGKKSQTKPADSMKREDAAGGPRPPLDQKEGGPILAPGEDAAKVHPVILQSRAAQAAQFGRETVLAGLARRVS